MNTLGATGYHNMGELPKGFTGKFCSGMPLVMNDSTRFSHEPKIVYRRDINGVEVMVEKWRLTENGKKQLYPSGFGPDYECCIVANVGGQEVRSDPTLSEYLNDKALFNLCDKAETLEGLSKSINNLMGAYFRYVDNIYDIVHGKEVSRGLDMTALRKELAKL